MLRMIRCETHGIRRWKGHVICDGCGRVFQTDEDDKPRFAPRGCPCGAELMPPASEQVGDKLGLTIAGTGTIYSDGHRVDSFRTRDSSDWLARPICYLCYRMIVKKWKGTLPDWEARRAEREGN